MAKFKRVVAKVLSFIFLLALIQVPVNSNAEDKKDSSEDVYVKIRYKREDKNYDGWNFWIWENGKEGKRVDFFGEDEDGKYAIIKTTKEAGSIGYILRKSVGSDDWRENYFGVNKTVDLSEGDKEIVINNEEDLSKRTAKEEKLNTEFDKVTLNLHYYRFDGDYSSYDVWAWVNSSIKNNPIIPGNGYGFTGEDSFGKIAKIEMDNVKSVGDKVVDNKGIGVIIRKPDWSDKDGQDDRFINLAYANKNGEIDAYLVQGSSEIAYKAEDAIKNPSITKAQIDSINEISFNTNIKLSDDIAKKVVLKENGKAIDDLETILKNNNKAVIVTKSNLDLSKEYTLEIEGYKSKVVTLGKVYGSEEFANLYTYNGKLGALYSKDKTTFVLWAPVASEVKLALYSAGNGGDAKEVKNMVKGEKGVWTLELPGDLNGVYYNYRVNNYGEEKEVTDPYAKALGVNGNRGMVIDMDSTNPAGWNLEKKPEFKDATDAVIYEMHIRDLTQSESSGASLEVRGKYKGVWQAGTRLFGKGDIKTGVDHLKELGITHVQLMPSFDIASVDEERLDIPQFNWGYDPQNFNAPEGSYSSNPYKAEVRIAEFKEMVKELHKAGIRVVMDVVYNHTSNTNSNLNFAVPDYYYRLNEDGTYSSASGCGNETASERSMVRKFMIDSVLHWVNDYHIDGFRFDLMAIHDVDTMKEIRKELNKIDESILMYGEGWTGGDSPLPDDKKALKVNTVKYGELQIGVFSDDMRDGIKGHVFESETPGFINGKAGLEDVIKFGIVASTKHNQVEYKGGPGPYSGYGNTPWANEPYQTVNYTSAHDNNTLWDKLQITNKKATKEELVAMNKLSASLILTSQGIPFFQAGEEIARTKVKEDGTFDDNSYKSPDSVNAINWARKEEYSDLFNYYKGLIALRKNHKAFRMNTTSDIQKSLVFLEKGKNFAEDNVIAYTIDGNVANDSFKRIAVAFNANENPVEITLPSDNWTVVANENIAGEAPLAEVKENKVVVPARSSYVLVGTESFKKDDTPKKDEGNGSDTGNKNGGTVIDNNGGDVVDNPVDSSVDNNNAADEALGNAAKTSDSNYVTTLVVMAMMAMTSIVIFSKKKVNNR
ncbi:MAG: type I pullulanase [Clostridium sp.]|nr:type I pullulanase [Clostridium sp.]